MAILKFIDTTYLNILQRLFLFILFILVTPFLIIAQKKGNDPQFFIKKNHAAVEELEQILEICNSDSISNDKIIENAIKGIQIARVHKDTFFETKSTKAS